MVQWGAGVGTVEVFLVKGKGHEGNYFTHEATTNHDVLSVYAIIIFFRIILLIAID